MNSLDRCILLFSGGRDSTIAALRLCTAVKNLTLLTVTSGHLVGLRSVRQRLAELAPALSSKTEWVHAVMRAEGAAEQNTVRTCLPCHHGYFAVASAVADQRQACVLAAGYTGYQSEWLEQSEYAIDQLRNVLSKFGKELLLPVRDLQSKEQAIAELRSSGLTIDALEQKCLVQQFNTRIQNEALRYAEIQRWAEALNAALAKPDSVNFEVLSAMSLGKVHVR
jgi:PP-loop superfamily ATP-utilizing enzyme